MHATNQSDSYRMLIHPGPCIVPAALATAELAGKSGKELVTALVAGYEVEARIASDFIPSTQARGFRCSPVYGALGAAVATGKLLDLTEDQLVTALALACTFAAGTTEGPRSGGQEMLFHEPNATRNGIMAALLAQEHVYGSETALEGEAGFYHAFVGNNRGELSYVFTGPQQTSLNKVVEALGSRWELLHVTPKIYPTAGYNSQPHTWHTRCRQHPLHRGLYLHPRSVSIAHTPHDGRRANHWRRPRGDGVVAAGSYRWPARPACVCSPDHCTDARRHHLPGCLPG